MSSALRMERKSETIHKPRVSEKQQRAYILINLSSDLHCIKLQQGQGRGKKKLQKKREICGACVFTEAYQFERRGQEREVGSQRRHSHSSSVPPETTRSCKGAAHTRALL